ncbi:MAG: S46 family peptidase [Bacteroidota bacterium]|nr:S46 family peptidase [Bacteroidota bacterium]
MRILKIALLALCFSSFAQQGGMWIPSMLKGDRETEMKNLGMKISAEDIYNHNSSSIKDAIVHFDGGCTSELISDQGLLLTNHHCGYGEIQYHSTIEKNYLQDGFWAMTKAEELPNPNLTATLIIKIDDVTTQVLKDTQHASTEIEKQQKIQKNIAELENTYPKEKHQNISLKSFYEGNQYILFVRETFKDVRLVGTPPSSIGKYGSDTDNWVWPRHTGDFMLFRIYADKDNKPAAYAKDNVPYKPKHFLPISLSGIEQGDFTMVFGFPGRTTEYLPSQAIDQLVRNINPAKIEIRDRALKTMDQYMRKDPNIKIQYASKYATIANGWKKWIGEKQGLEKTNVLKIKQDFETEFAKRVNKQNKQAEYGNILGNFQKYYSEFEKPSLAYNIFVETFLRNVELFNVSYRLYQLEQVYQTKGEQAFEDRKQNLLTSLQDFYKDFNKEVDQKVFEQVFDYYLKNTPPSSLPAAFKNIDINKLSSEMYGSSKITTYAGLTELLNNGKPADVIKHFHQDIAFATVNQAATTFFKEVNAEYERINTLIAASQRTYMKAILELFPEERIFPDANGTMRITYGKVNGYAPRDAVNYEPVTYLGGVIEKYIPGDYEFDLPQKLIDLYHTKDFGIYGVNGKMPVNFIATNHTTGGNSGSPALDAYGNLIGLNFDRVWEGTMSDVYYDPAISRNIMVDARYILFIIDKYAGAKHLIDEMKLVYPKMKNKELPTKKSKKTKKNTRKK